MFESWTEIYVFIIVLIMFTTKIIVFKKEDAEMEVDEEAESDPIVVVDPAKALAQNVKFVMRLKKRMKEFKARKIKESLDHS